MGLRHHFRRIWDRSYFVDTEHYQSIEKTSDQPTLVRIARYSGNPDRRTEAIKRVLDQSIIAKVALSDSSPKARIEAALRLADNSQLVAIAHKDRDPEVRAAVVAKIDDPTVLAQIANRDAAESVRNAAMKALAALTTERTTIVKIAMTDNSLAAGIATDRINDQPTLIQIARGAKSFYSRSRAAQRVLDQAVLASVALTDQHWSIREEAAKRLTDESVLAKVALEDASLGVRRQAAKRLTNQDVLVRLAQSDPDESVRGAAVARVTDQAVLADVAMKEAKKGVGAFGDEWLVLDSHRAALKGLTDPAALARVAGRALEHHIREEAFDALSKIPTVSPVLVERLASEVRRGHKRISTLRADAADNLLKGKLSIDEFIEAWNVEEESKAKKDFVESSIDGMTADEFEANQDTNLLDRLVRKLDRKA